ncbi:class I SAM-dependent methyltransferase [Mariniflexile sp. AS56]|uniref:class I SAM-dependent methyltransferase n=1 Tax=Mariniflexile sp. AS56 TaxID=3063957 RepID=UPI0026F2BED0|nr:class I SAM-dependent methyltransferase [Mariniflexile sp. AS56]MDO7173701.1 class I SAM-dependent methyltransferase [Mariniflexile sp. AS56]
MTLIEKQYIKQYHSVRLKCKNLARSKMMGWTSKKVQQIRFQVITSLFNFDNASVLDLGCGDGDFNLFLELHYSIFHYIGIDLHESFIHFAKERFKEKTNTWFYNTDFTHCQLPKVDIVVACGALSYRSHDPNYYINCIEKFYNSANKALIFNMLNEDFFESGQLIVAHNKDHVFEQCKEICNNVILKDGYLDNDFTIIMTKSTQI